MKLSHMRERIGCRFVRFYAFYFGHDKPVANTLSKFKHIPVPIYSPYISPWAYIQGGGGGGGAYTLVDLGCQYFAGPFHGGSYCIYSIYMRVRCCMCRVYFKDVLGKSIKMYTYR